MLRALLGSRLPRRYQKYFDLPPGEESYVPELGDDLMLRRTATAYLGDSSGNSAVYRLSHGGDALSVRLALIRAAERCIDIQSYLIKDDISGNLIALALIDAAARGVRVRLLMDDALTEAINDGLVTLNHLDNIEVRVFNPFPRRRSRFISFIANFNILNRRMHNKSFTVDDSVTIVGGRNIADEYYQAGGPSEFVDEDLLAVGPVVGKVSAMFDLYWNTRESIPVSVFEEFVSPPPLEKIVDEGERYLEAQKNQPLLRQLDRGAGERLLDGQLDMTIAPVRLICDHPDKVRRLDRAAGSDTIQFLQKLVGSAQQELIVVSPYFVPRRQGVEFLSALVRAGVRVVVITNSLASTNHSSVHSVYARYRKPLLRAGVELHELSPARVRVDTGKVAGTGLTLHSKIAVVDRQYSFIGSFNLDPRSLYLNTEMGMVVDAAEFGTDIANSILELLPTYTYRLDLDGGRLVWHHQAAGAARVLGTEPDTDVGRRFWTRLMGYLPIEGQM